MFKPPGKDEKAKIKVLFYNVQAFGMPYQIVRSGCCLGVCQIRQRRRVRQNSFEVFLRTADLYGYMKDRESFSTKSS
ncbi:hypothetical protein ACVLD2_000204 [Paenibacillus sp. PvR052]